ncbi:hypothetical protein [Roseovarius sp. MS2]|uniref:hypothetical protein n=1 Tax=Roseovarius sp. MS2 TaxID=3390728 RepID=UPI003F5B48F4
MILVNLIDKKKRGLHHWWPKGLQRNWVNSNGQIHMRKGNLVQPKNPERNATGSKRNAHYFDVGDSPWSHSFEDAFQIVDTKGAEAARLAIERVRSQRQYRTSRNKLTAWLPFSAARTDAQFECLPSDKLHSLARVAISVVIRSPAFQFRRSVVHPAFRQKNVIEPAIGTANIFSHWADFYNDPHLPKGPIGAVFMISNKDKEFVIGDGFYETVIDQKRFIQAHNGEWQPRLQGAILFPIAPDICCLILLNTMVGQRLAILSNDETEEINKITCLISRNEIYSRTPDQPHFEPQNEETVRRVTLTEHSFLKPWLAQRPTV